MTNDEIRTKVAELCGWKRQGEFFRRTTAKGLEVAKMDGDWCNHNQIPNYPESLDACREFEDMIDKVDNNSTRDAYYRYLCVIKGFAFPLEAMELFERFHVATATPLQRCESFLRMKGAWNE